MGRIARTFQSQSYNTVVYTLGPNEPIEKKKKGEDRAKVRPVRACN